MSFIRYIYLTGLLTLIWSGASCHTSMNLDILDKNRQLSDAKEKLLRDSSNEEALRLILSMLSSDEDTVARANAASTLGDLGEKMDAVINGKAIPALVQALERDDAWVKSAAAKSLGKFGAHAREAVPILRKNLVPSNTDVAWHSAESLGLIGSPAREAVPDLVRVIKHASGEYRAEGPDIREFATEALGKIGPDAKDAVTELLQLLESQNPYLRINLSTALIRISPNNQKSLDTLQSLLKEEDVDVRRKTIWSLRDIGVKAQPAEHLVETSLSDRDEDVRAAAHELLQIIRNNKNINFQER